MANALTATEERALILLGQGNISLESVAAACGVSVSRISQLMSEEEFSSKVTELRFNSLQKYNEQDSSYDDIEKQATEQLKKTLPLIMRPMELVKVIQVINGAKRRGTSAPEAILEKQQVVNISLPSVVINNYTNLQPVTNVHNQVVRVGDQDLTTLQSSSLLSAHKKEKEAREQLALEDSNGQTGQTGQTVQRAKPDRSYENV